MRNFSRVLKSTLVTLGATALGISASAQVLLPEAKRQPYPLLPEIALFHHILNPQMVDVANETLLQLGLQVPTPTGQDTPDLPMFDQLYLRCVAYGAKGSNTILNSDLNDLSSPKMVVERGPMDANFVIGDTYGKGDEAYAICNSAAARLADHLEETVRAHTIPTGAGFTPTWGMSEEQAIPAIIYQDTNLAMGATNIRPFFVRQYGIGQFDRMEQIYDPFEVDDNNGAIEGLAYDFTSGPVAGLRQLQIEDIEDIMKAAEYGRNFMAITDEEKAVVRRDIRRAQINIARAKSALNTLRILNAMNFAPFEGNAVLDPKDRSRVIKGPDITSDLVELTGVDPFILTPPNPGFPFPSQRNLVPAEISLSPYGNAVVSALHVLENKGLVLILSGNGLCPAVTSYGDCLATIQEKDAYEGIFAKPEFEADTISTAKGGLGVTSGKDGLGPLVLERVLVTGKNCTKEVDGETVPRLLGSEPITSANVCALVTHLEDKENMRYDGFQEQWVEVITDPIEPVETVGDDTAL